MHKTYIEDKNEFHIKYSKYSSEPLQFISIMFAIIKLEENLKKGKRICVNNPILFDASCNGIQHLSAMTRELDLAIRTNVLGKEDNIKNERPKDFYLYAAKLIQKELDKHPKENLRNILLDRSLIKKSVMTVPYNISLTGIGEQLREHFSITKEFDKTFFRVDSKYSKSNKTIFLYPNEFGELTKIVYLVLTQKLPSLKTLSSYLDKLLKIVTKTNSYVV